MFEYDSFVVSGAPDDIARALPQELDGRGEDGWQLCDVTRLGESAGSFVTLLVTVEREYAEVEVEVGLL